jgi:hypothetical protein
MPQTAPPEPLMTHHPSTDPRFIGTAARLSSVVLLLAMCFGESRATVAMPNVSTQSQEIGREAQSARAQGPLIDAYYYFVHWVSMGRSDKALEQFDPEARVIAGAGCTAEAPCIGRVAIGKQYLPALLAGELPLPLAGLRSDGSTLRTYGDTIVRRHPIHSSVRAGDHEINLGSKGIVSLRFDDTSLRELNGVSDTAARRPTGDSGVAIRIPAGGPTDQLISDRRDTTAVLVHRFAIPDDSSWGAIAIDLSTGGWRVGDANGSVATNAQLRYVLRDVASIEIGGVCTSHFNGPTSYPCGFSLRDVDLAGTVAERFAAMGVDDGLGQAMARAGTEAVAAGPSDNVAATPGAPRLVTLRLPSSYLGDRGATLGGTLRFEIQALSNPLVASHFDRTSGLVVLRSRRTLQTTANDADGGKAAFAVTPATEAIDVVANPLVPNRLDACRLSGEVILWASRPLRVLDDMGDERGTVEAGLAQFGDGSWLDGCTPDGTPLDISGAFTNFLVAASWPSDRVPADAVSLASQLTKGFFRLAQLDGNTQPMIEGISARAVGSVAHQFAITLIRRAPFGAYDIAINRQTVRTKFSPRLVDSDRRASTLSWSSARTADGARAFGGSYR